MKHFAEFCALEGRHPVRSNPLLFRYSEMLNFSIRQFCSRLVQHPSRRRRSSSAISAAETLEDRRLLSAVYGDFNGDGYDDLAVGVPGEDVSSIVDAGAVNVIYGNFLAMTSVGDEIWHQPYGSAVGSGHLDGVAESGDQFGFAVAAGDFNNDGFEDLAVGIPGQEVNGIQSAGAVQILYGSSTGLNHSGDKVIHQDSLGMEDQAEAFDRFGSVLMSGDFNGDGFADLAIGVPHENVDNMNNAGAVHVLFGAASGLQSQLAAKGQFWHQNVSGIGDGNPAERYDNFGGSLATGDFDGDGVDDLAIGAPGEDIGRTADAGMIHLVMGQAGTGLVTTGSLTLVQGGTVADDVEEFDYFGASLAAGDFNADGRDDLAVGVPGEDIGSIVDAGAVHVFPGHAINGLSTTGEQFWHQNIGGVRGVSEESDLFGTSLAAADLNGDGRDDLAIGVPGQDVGSEKDAGNIHVLYARSSGLSSINDDDFSQNDLGLNNEAIAASGNAFGSWLAAGYGNAGTFADLAVTAPGQRVSGKDDAGAVYTLFGNSSSGWANSLNQVWSQSSSGIEGVAEHGDRVGGQFPVGLQSRGIEVPVLNSNPDASRTLYLDFDGHEQFNWNGRSQNTSTPVFDVDGQRGHFNSTELQIIEDAWAAAAEDFAPFDINVTTVDPGGMKDGISLRVAIGGYADDWYMDPNSKKKRTSGVAKMDNFTNPKLPNIAYVFAETIAVDRRDIAVDDVALLIGSTIAHEAGHAIGLQHKSEFDLAGNELVEYSGGEGDWTPIMGANMQQDRTIWTGKEYTLKSAPRQIQGDDDLYVLNDLLGARIDDHGQDLESATSLGTLNAFRNSAVGLGIVENVADTDTFTFTVSETGPLTIQLLANDVSANLDSFLSFGPTVSFGITDTHHSSPADDLNAALTVFNVTPGQYYVNVRSVGQLQGDIGQYTLRLDLGVTPPVSRPVTILEPTQYFSESLFKTKTSDEQQQLKSLAGDSGSTPVLVRQTVNQSGSQPTSQFDRETRSASMTEAPEPARKQTEHPTGSLRQLDELFASTGLLGHRL